MLQQRKSKRPKRTQSSLKRKSRKVSFQGQVGHRRRHQKRACRKISCFQAMTVRHKIWLICVSNIEAVLFFLWTTFQASLDASGLGWGTWLVSGYFCWTASCCRLYAKLLISFNESRCHSTWKVNAYGRMRKPPSSYHARCRSFKSLGSSVGKLAGSKLGSRSRGSS